MIDNNRQFANSPGDGKSAGAAGLALDRSGGVALFPAGKNAGGCLRNRAPLCTGGMAARFSLLNLFRAMPVTVNWGRNGKQACHRVGDGVRS